MLRKFLFTCYFNISLVVVCLVTIKACNGTVNRNKTKFESLKHIKYGKLMKAIDSLFTCLKRSGLFGGLVFFQPIKAI